MKPRIRVNSQQYHTCLRMEDLPFLSKPTLTDLLDDINKGVDMANEHFKKKGIKAKAFNVDKVVIYETKN